MLKKNEGKFRTDQRVDEVIKMAESRRTRVWVDLKGGSGFIRSCMQYTI